MKRRHSDLVHARRRQSRRAFLKRSILLGVAAGTSWRSGQQLPEIAGDVVFCWVGGVTARSARVNAKVAADGRYRLVVSTRADLANPVTSSYGTAQRSANNRVVPLSIDGLQPNTAYFYGVAREGAAPDLAVTGRFTTFPDGAASFTFACAACAATGSNRIVFKTIEDQKPLFFLHMGDLHYENIAVNDRNVFRAAYDRVLASPRQHALYRNVPTAYMWDDHDFGPNNADRNAPGRTASRLTYQEYVPHYPLAAGSGDVPIYQAFTVGRVRVILTDCRSERTPYTATDNASKSMLGTAQKAWFKQQLLEAKGRYPVIVWVNTLPWIGTTGSDGWYAYATERREIAEFIKANGIKGVVQLAGDAHMIAIDDGRNSDYASGGGAPIPVLHAAALDASGSVKGGPYSHGAIAGAGHFGMVSITDTGGDKVQVRFSARNELNQERIGLSMTFTATPVQPSKVATEYLWSGGLTPTSAVICARSDRDGVVRLVASTQESFAGRVINERVEIRDMNARTFKRALTALAPGTTYFYGLVTENDTGAPSVIGRLRTPPQGSFSFSFAVGSDAQTGSSHPVFDAIRSGDPLFLLHLGGLFQEDIQTNDATRYRDAFARSLKATRQKDLYRTLPVAYMWDDHDYGAGQSDATMPGRLAARTVYHEIVPHAPLVEPGVDSAPYQAFSIGRVRFLLLDLRSERTPSDREDGPDKSMLGGAQREWLQRELLEGHARGEVMIIASSSPWIGTAVADGWHSYAWERQALALFIRRHRLRRIVLLDGDAGVLAIDDGSHADFAPDGGAPLPVFQCGPLDSDPGVPEPVYSFGPIAGRGQFGLVSVEDRENEITLQLSGRDAGDTELLRHTVRFSMTPQVVGLTSGAQAPDGAVVKAMLDRPASISFTLRRDAESSDIEQTQTVTADVDSGYVATARWSGLAPDTAYRCEAWTNFGERLAACLYRTLPLAGPASFRFVVGWGAETGSEGAVFEAMERQKALFMLHLGGLHSASMLCADIDAHLWAHERALRSNRQRSLFARTPLISVPDETDVDFFKAANPAEARSVALEANAFAIPRIAPSNPEQHTAAYRAFTVGRVRVIMLDLVTFAPLGPPSERREASLLGPAQLGWLKRELLEANGRTPLIFVASSMPWIDPKEEIGWGEYVGERAELAAFIDTYDIQGLVLLTGGLDMVGIDDGTNAHYAGAGAAFPVLSCGSLDRTPSRFAGSYSEGKHRGRGQFGVVSIRDDGTAIEAMLSCRDSNNAELLRYTLVVDHIWTGTEEAEDPVSALEPAFPNPFSEETTVRFSLPEGMPVRVDLFDALGRHVRTLLDGTLPRGRHEAMLSGRGLAPGAYVVRISTPRGVRSAGVVRV